MDYERLMVPLEYRADDSNDSPGVLTATLMTYGQRGRIRPEMFEMDALHWGDDGIVIRELHPPKDAQGRPIITTPPIMRAMPYLEGRELKISAPLPNSTRGRDVAEVMKGPNPLYGGMSIEFAPEQQVSRGGLRIISRAYLDGAALVFRGEYADAIVEVRAELERRPEIFLWL